MTRWLLALAAVVVAATALAACGGSDGGETATGQTATGAADTGAAAAGAPCTTAALEEALKASDPNTPVKVLMHSCEGGWASGAILVGSGEESYEAAFLAKDEGGSWVVPSKLPCDDTSIPAKILDSSPCKVS